MMKFHNSWALRNNFHLEIDFSIFRLQKKKSIKIQNITLSKIDNDKKTSIVYVRKRSEKEHDEYD